ncbi:MAG: hypothetical protein BroJett012_08610 [Betaproteobacteria bacterium]|jgi:hypothetical protein|nr:MAG: hypothetical protein BroJett012_08610 [Betaproteobacteria bacterium]
MAIPTSADVTQAFDSIGGPVVQPMALRFSLEKRGFDVSAATYAINQALTDGVLGKTPSGGLFLKSLVR